MLWKSVGNSACASIREEGEKSAYRTTMRFGMGVSSSKSSGHEDIYCTVRAVRMRPFVALSILSFSHLLSFSFSMLISFYNEQGLTFPLQSLQYSFPSCF